MVLVECSCSLEKPYADGSLPIYYTDKSKAIYMWKKLRQKAIDGSQRVRDGEALPNLQDYNLYYGVHLNNEHVLTGED